LSENEVLHALRECNHWHHDRLHLRKLYEHVPVEKDTRDLLYQAGNLQHVKNS